MVSDWMQFLLWWLLFLFLVILIRGRVFLLRDSRASEMRAPVKVNPRETGAASRLSRVGWFSPTLAFRSLYYPWAKMVTACSLIRGARVVQLWEHSLPPMWPWFKSRRRHHMWVEFVVGSILALRGFSPGPSVFPSRYNPTFPTIQSRTHRHVSRSYYEFLSALWVNKQQITICSKFTTTMKMHVSSLPSFYIILRIANYKTPSAP